MKCGAISVISSRNSRAFDAGQEEQEKVLLDGSHIVEPRNFSLSVRVAYSVEYQTTIHSQITTVLA